jgi:murein DD-endopeptidase MepM/ murein hydrolase activator NlpD
MIKRRVAILLILLIISGCAARGEGSPVFEVVRVYITATPKPSETPAATTAPTLTPTPTHTPTPTAIPARIAGNPRVVQLNDPTPAYGAPCGLVDTFDFPLDPPHGENASGGFGFGAYADRYEKFHAGEDWGFRNQPNLGKPVYSIGHGQVTYAAPNGWGLDRGTVVIRHVFPWGGYVLSFYGHLDPLSVRLKAGDCVERGDQIGAIGNPRTPPHLHFEIRLHLPNSAGHGYWSTDPAKAGWLPPSQTIWKTRLLASPGVLWILPYEVGLTRGLGAYLDGFILIQGGEMRAVDPSDGSLLWSQVISETVRTALLDEETSRIYQLDLSGDITAYPLPDPSDPVWKLDTNVFSTAALIPFPNGGLLLADRRRAIGINSMGEIGWETGTSAPVISWVHYDGNLIFTTSDSEVPIWSATASSISGWDVKINGKLAVVEDVVFLYATDGLYRLNVQDRSAVLMRQLPKTNPQLLELIAGPEGNLFLLHSDLEDRRLMVFDPNGSLTWERSIATLPRGDLQFFNLGEVVYLLNVHSGPPGIQVDMYNINPESDTLTHILTGGSRQSHIRDVWVEPITPDQLLLNIGGGSIVAFDPKSAFQVISLP